MLIYMGITMESSIKDYWGNLEPAGVGYVVKNYIGLIRFQQFNRYFRYIDPQLKDDSTPYTTFNRVNSLSKHLQLRYYKLYTPRTYLAVNKTIQHFIGRVSKIINILLKPTLEGFKVQVLANKGYILNQLQHAKGNNKGLVDLNTIFIKEEGFLKIQVVILNLLFQRDTDTNKPLYPHWRYIIQLNNLFISIKLLTKLRQLGIRGVGTI